ncbi:retrovirus-related Pol polyprotein from transposon 297 [Trichonephila clavipes]|nr:retrovirus-related Pol polyprotein from transposon 297 [Trichonephila clavipes]
MTEEKLIDHVISRLEPQILDYVEVGHPQNTSNLLQIIDKYEERFLNGKIKVRVGNSEIQTKARTIVSLTGIGRKIGTRREPGLTHLLYHEIDTGDKGPVVSRPYRYDKVKQGIIDYHIEKMLQEEAPVLQLPNFKEQFNLLTDASGVGIGAELNQNHRPIAFASRTLNKAKRNYTVTERECLVVIWALNKLKTYFRSLPVKESSRQYGWITNFVRSSSSLRLELREQLIREQREDNELGHIYCYLENPNDGSVKATVCENLSQDFKLIDGLLFYAKYSTTLGELRVYIPRSLREAIMKEFNDLPLAGYLGKRKTNLKLRDTCYFPYMRKYIFEYVSTCDRCQKFKYKNALPAGRLIPIVSNYPNEIVTLDLLGPYPASRPERYRFLLVITDHFTKWSELIPLRKANALFENYISRYGAPISLISDNSPQFISEIFEHLSHRMDIKHMKTVTYRPQRVLNMWKETLRNYSLRQGRICGNNTKLGKKYYNRKRREVNIKVNDLALVQTHFMSAAGRRVVGKFMPKCEGPYRVLEVWNNNLMIWKKGKRLTVNIDQVRVYHPRQSDTISSDSHVETLYDGQRSRNESSRSRRKIKDLGKPRVRERITVHRRSLASNRYQSRQATYRGSRQETSGQYDKARETRTTTSGTNRAAERRPIRSKQVTAVIPCPFYPRSRVKQSDGIPEERRSNGIDGILQNNIRRSLSMEALDGDPVDRIE